MRGIPLGGYCTPNLPYIFAKLLYRNTLVILILPFLSSPVTIPSQIIQIGQLCVSKMSRCILSEQFMQCCKGSCWYLFWTGVKGLLWPTCHSELKSLQSTEDTRSAKQVCTIFLGLSNEAVRVISLPRHTQGVRARDFLFWDTLERGTRGEKGTWWKVIARSILGNPKAAHMVS